MPVIHALQLLRITNSVLTSPFEKGELGGFGNCALKKTGINQFNVAIGSKSFWLRMLVTLAASFKLLAANVAALETVNMALSNKNFQMILYPIAQERGYMQEEGIDLRVILARAELSVQATMAGSFQFNMAGTMAVVNVMKGGAPFKVILATNDKVLSWILSKPEITTLKELKGKRVATSGVANVTLIMAKQVMQKHGIDPDRDINFINTGGGSNGVRALMAGAVDGVVASRRNVTSEFPPVSENCRSSADGDGRIASLRMKRSAFSEEFAKTEFTQLNSPTAFESCASSHSDSFTKMAGKRKRLNSSCQFLAFIPHVYGYPRRVGRTPFIYFEKLK